MQPNTEATARTVASGNSNTASLPHGLTARERDALTAMPLTGWRTTREALHYSGMRSVLGMRLALLALASRGLVAHAQAAEGAVWRLTWRGRLALTAEVVS